MIRQTNDTAWRAARIGRFTASKMHALMSQPRNAADRAAGMFSAAGRDYITAKAIERATGIAMDSTEPHSFGMRRGMMLEPAALFLLGERWKTCHGCTWQPIGDHAGSTPDALVDGGEPMDLKCPTNPCDVVRFGIEVDDSFDSLLAWDAHYAWQIAMQALSCGTDRAHLVLFTDALPIIKITDTELGIAQELINDAAARYSDRYGWPWQYDYPTDGLFFVARSFKVGAEVKARITSTLDRANAECDRIAAEVKQMIDPAWSNA